MSNQPVEKFIDGYLEIIKTLEEIKGKEFIKGKFNTKSWDLNSYHEAIALLSKNSEKLKFIDYFLNSTFNNKVLNKILEKVNLKKLSMDDYYFLKGIIFYGLFDDTILQIFNNIVFNIQNFKFTILIRKPPPNMNIQFNRELIIPALYILFLIYTNAKENEKEKMKENLRNLITSGRIFFYFQEAITQNITEIIALCFLLFMIIPEANKGNLNFGNEPFRTRAQQGINNYKNYKTQPYWQDKNVLISMKKITDELPKIYDELFWNLYNNTEEEGQIFKELIKYEFEEDKENAIKKFSPYIIEFNKFLNEILDKEIFKEYMEKNLSDKESFSKILKKTTYNPQNSHHRHFAYWVFENNLDTPELAEWLYKELSKLDKEKWKKLISSSFYTSQIVRYLAEKYEKYIERGLREALEEVIEELFEAEEEFEKGQFLGFKKGLENGVQKIFEENMLDKLLSNSDKNLTILIKYCGEIFENCEVLKQRKNDLFRKILLNNLLKEIEEQPEFSDNLKWFVELCKKCNLSKYLNRDLKKEILKKIDELIPDTESLEETFTLLNELKELLK